ncbi:hypothetical protein DPMN_100996 [Dreissena polymorpha]|uniref:EGF-like domain-containing protein n=1 Tax=Dreissena polymorpha TaxID=45954 RepID=A0A9D4R8Q1_DREPO|nr:hypothetical protein DPMN_100996 [Dreissena polymorpha]
MLRVCICIKGYSFDNNGNCVDIDECAVNHHDPCGHRGQCANTIGGYTCSCLQGWSNDSLCSKNVSDPALCMPGYTGNRCSDATCGQHGYAQPIGLNDFRQFQM